MKPDGQQRNARSSKKMKPNVGLDKRLGCITLQAVSSAEGFDPPRLHHPTRQTIKPPVPPPGLSRDHGAPGRRIRRGGLPERPPRRASQRRRSVNSNKKTATINCLHDCMLLHLQQISSTLSLDSCAHLQQKLDLNCVLARVGRWLSEPS